MEEDEISDQPVLIFNVCINVYGLRSLIRQRQSNTWFLKYSNIIETILLSTHNIAFLHTKKKIILNYPKSATMEFVPKDVRTSSKQPWYTSNQCSSH